jgi:putative transposase
MHASSVCGSPGGPLTTLASQHGQLPIGVVPCKRRVASITGSVDEELLLRTPYVATESAILRAQLRGRLRLRDGERNTAAEIGKQLGQKGLPKVDDVVTPETIPSRRLRLVAQKLDGSKQRSSPGRPTIDPELEELILRLARHHRTRDHDRSAGAAANRGYAVSD